MFAFEPDTETIYYRLEDGGIMLVASDSEGVVIPDGAVAIEAGEYEKQLEAAAERDARRSAEAADQQNSVLLGAGFSEEQIAALRAAGLAG